MKRLVAVFGAFGMITAVISVLGATSSVGFASLSSTAYACGDTACSTGGEHGSGGENGDNGGKHDGENGGNDAEANDSNTPDADDENSDGSLDKNCNYCKSHPGDARCKKHTPPPAQVPEIPMGGLLLGSLSSVATVFGLIAARRRTSEI